MPPKKKKQDDATADDKENVSMPLPSGLEEFIDSRLNQQMDKLHDLFLKFTVTTKSDLQSIKESQNFLAAKFDELVVSTSELKAENRELRRDNSQLQDRISVLESQCTSANNEVEDIKRYLRRDLLELHGIPERPSESTSELVVKLVDLVAPELDFSEQDISISHRLPAAVGRIKPIIVKFVRRDVRDAILKKKRNLVNLSSQDLGLEGTSRLFINESLTANSRAILNKAKEFKRRNHFKFVWSKHGKIFLKKDEGQSATHGFSTIQEFNEFYSRYNRE